jgi:hypothetical protein
MASYNEELYKRAYQHFNGLVDVEEVYHFVKAVALESFKNGLAAGKAKSASRARSAQTTTRSE